MSADVTDLYTSWKTSDLIVLGKEIFVKENKKYTNRILSVLYSLRAKKLNKIALTEAKRERERERERGKQGI